jgi:hypothetical protein
MRAARARRLAIGTAIAPARSRRRKGAVEYAAPQVRDAGTLCLGGARGAFRPHPGARGSGGRTLCTRLVDARHPGRLHRRAGPKASVARGGERDYRAAVGGVRGLFQARSFRVCDRLSLCRRHRRTPPSGAETGGGARRLGHRRRWAQGPGGVDGRFEGKRRDGSGLLPRPARTRPRRSIARRLRRRAGNHSGDRGRLSTLSAPALLGPPHAQPRHQGLG